MKESNLLNEISKTIVINSLEKEPLVDWGVSGIKAPQAWLRTKGEGVKIATIDTGIDMSHPDLKERIKGTINMFERSLDVTDEYGHGTHVAGLIAGKHTGVAPEADLYIAKVLNGNGKGSLASVMDGITFAINFEVDILCMSLGIPNNMPLILKQRIVEAYEAGVTIICAVGNDGHNQALYPACMNEVIGVGGLDKDFSVTSFSNGGYDVLAPSTEILSTYKDSNYARMSGTSMASPIVAGAVALLISYYREQGEELKPSEIKNMISGTLDLTKFIK